MAGGSSRPGKGSRVPKNVKIRPAPPIEERAKARRKGTGKNAKDEVPSDEDEDEEDRLAREQLAQDSGDGDDREGNETMGREDDQRPLEGMIVCSSGHLGLPREDIKTMCEALGAVFEQVLTTETTFLLSDTTESDKYKACVENGIPVIRSSFVLELHHRWLELIDCDVVGLSNFLRLPPLQDLTICLTGYGDDRNEHRNMISQSGGAAYSPELTNEVTHLVVGPSFTSKDELMHNGKYMYAKQINMKRAKRQEAKKPIWIVWGEWLEHCLYAFGRVKEEFYSTEVVADRHEVRPPPGQRSQDIMERRNSTSPKKLQKQKSRSDHAQIKLKRRLIKQDTNASMDGSDLPWRKRSATAEEPGSSIVAKRAKTDLSTGQIRAETRDDADVHEYSKGTKDELEPAAVKKQSPALAANLLKDNAAGLSTNLAPRAPLAKQRSTTQMEIMGVQDLLIPKAELPPQQMTVASSSTTKTIPAKPEKTATISQLPYAAKGSLLSQMGKERSNKFVNKAKESACGSTHQEAATAELTLQPPEPESSGIHSRSASPVPESALAVDAKEGTANIDEPTSGTSAIFASKRFYIMPGDFDSNLHSRIANLMVERGGLPSDPISAKSDLIICKTISNKDIPFDFADTRLVTADWIEACMAFDDIVEDIPLIEAFKRPVRCTLPLPGLLERRICVSYSGFDADYEKPKLTRWLDTLGIPHEPVIRRRDMDGKLKTTHVIIPDQSYRSQRLGTAQEWGIQVVYPRWLRDMAVQHALPPASEVNSIRSPDPSPVDNQIADSQKTAGPSSDDLADDNGPLKGSRVHISRKVEDWRGLEKLAITLGARTIQHFDSEMAKSATHLVFQSSQTKPAGKEFSLALHHRVKVVHPDWLRHTAQKGIKQAEASFKHTRNSKRSLEILVEAQSMSRVSSSSSSKSLAEATTPDDYDLPPPLNFSSNVVAPSMQGLDLSFTRSIRSSQPPTSPSTSLTVLSSSAGLCASTPDRPETVIAEADQNAADLSVHQSKADDSGFAASARKNSHKSSVTATNTTTADLPLEPANDENPISRKDLMAEMEALMQTNDLTPQQLSARLPFQQQGAYQSRTSLRKAIGRSGDSALPNTSASLRASASSSVFMEKASLPRRQAFPLYDESQFGQQRNEETQTQAMLDEQTMVIKINDPVAEATKAKTLAEIRRARSGEGSNETAIDPEATQRSTDETMRASTRRSRSAARRGLNDVI